MKEFKFYGEMTEYVEIPVTVFETQKELLEQISGVIRDAKDLGMGEEESIYIIYKDGSKYFIYDEEEIGKFKRYGIKAAVYEHVNGYEVYGDFAVTDNGDISIEESDIEEYGVYNGQYDVKEEPESVETVESVEETTVSETETVEETAEQETELNAEVAQVEAEQTAEPETFSYEFNEIHKITISKRNNVYVEEFFEKMGGSYVKLGEEAWGCIEDIEEYYGIKINRNVQTDTEESESESESESEPTADSNTVETYQGNINVLIVADIANTFEMITHTGYFDTS